MVISVALPETPPATHQPLTFWDANLSSPSLPWWWPILPKSSSFCLPPLHAFSLKFTLTESVLNKQAITIPYRKTQRRITITSSQYLMLGPFPTLRWWTDQFDCNYPCMLTALYISFFKVTFLFFFHYIYIYMERTFYKTFYLKYLCKDFLLENS